VNMRSVTPYYYSVGIKLSKMYGSDGSGEAVCSRKNKSCADECWEPLERAVCLLVSPSLSLATSAYSTASTSRRCHPLSWSWSLRSPGSFFSSCLLAHSGEQSVCCGNPLIVRGRCIYAFPATAHWRSLFSGFECKTMRHRRVISPVVETDIL
jgi:hypothetical protein